MRINSRKIIHINQYFNAEDRRELRKEREDYNFLCGSLLKLCGSLRLN